MSVQSRLKKIENTKRKAKDDMRVIVMYDSYDDVPAIFDGEKMTQAEAERKAAALPEDVLLIRVVRASEVVPQE